MNILKFITYQFGLFTALLLVNTIADPYISHPFSFVDFIAICILLPIFILISMCLARLYRQFQAKLGTKVFLSIVAFLLAVIFIGLIENLWFALTGHMLF